MESTFRAGQRPQCARSLSLLLSFSLFLSRSHPISLPLSRSCLSSLPSLPRTSSSRRATTRPSAPDIHETALRAHEEGRLPRLPHGVVPCTPIKTFLRETKSFRLRDIRDLFAPISCNTNYFLYVSFIS